MSRPLISSSAIVYSPIEPQTPSRQGYACSFIAADFLQSFPSIGHMPVLFLSRPSSSRIVKRSQSLHESSLRTYHTLEQRPILQKMQDVCWHTSTVNQNHSSGTSALGHAGILCQTLLAPAQRPEHVSKQRALQCRKTVLAFFPLASKYAVILVSHNERSMLQISSMSHLVEYSHFVHSNVPIKRLSQLYPQQPETQTATWRWRRPSANGIKDTASLLQYHIHPATRRSTVHHSECHSISLYRLLTCVSHKPLHLLFHHALSFCFLCRFVGIASSPRLSNHHCGPSRSESNVCANLQRKQCCNLQKRLPFQQLLLQQLERSADSHQVPNHSVASFPDQQHL